MLHAEVSVPDVRQDLKPGVVSYRKDLVVVGRGNIHLRRRYHKVRIAAHVSFRDYLVASIAVIGDGEIGGPIRRTPVRIATILIRPRVRGSRAGSAR